MNFIKALEVLNKGNKVRRKCWDEDFYLYKNGAGNVFMGNFDTNINTRYIPGNINLSDDDWEIVKEEKKPILDKEEKAYLEAVLRPFKGRIKYIEKAESPFEPLERIIITYKNVFYVMSFPSFQENTMYKGMVLNKEYTLKELGLFEND